MKTTVNKHEEVTHILMKDDWQVMAWEGAGGEVFGQITFPFDRFGKDVSMTFKLLKNGMPSNIDNDNYLYLNVYREVPDRVRRRLGKAMREVRDESILP